MTAEKLKVIKIAKKYFPTSFSRIILVLLITAEER